MYLQKVISTNLLTKLVFCWLLEGHDEIAGSGSVSKCHGSATLVQLRALKYQKFVPSLVQNLNREHMYQKRFLGMVNARVCMFKCTYSGFVLYLRKFFSVALNEIPPAAFF
jgi:hypothetical protein